MKYFEFAADDYMIAAESVDEAKRCLFNLIGKSYDPVEVDYNFVFMILSSIIGYVPEEELMEFNSPSVILNEDIKKLMEGIR